MGFKKVDFNELKTQIGPNFLGIPIRDGGKLVEKGFREKKIETSYMGSLSEILILNEEFLEFQYGNDGKRKSAAKAPFTSKAQMAKENMTRHSIFLDFIA